VEIEKEVLDFIHDYIVIDDEDYRLLDNDFVKKELERLSEIAHLGLMAKLRRLVRHDKLEHAYGTYWLCTQCVEENPKLVKDHVPFRLAGILHGIGHAAFSYDTEYAIAKLYKLHEPTRKWIDDVFNVCIDFTNEPGIKKSADNMKSEIDYKLIHRWFGAHKIAKSEKSELNTDIGKQIVRILLDTDLIQSRLLTELDKLDYILRDMLYLAIGRIDLNFPLLLKQFDKGKNGLLIRPNVSEIIETTSDCLCSQVYLNREERCLRQLLEKCIVKEVMEGKYSVEEILSLKSDKDMENQLLRFDSGGLDIEESIRKIKSGEIFQVVSISGDLGENSLFDVEMDLVRTNRAGIHKYTANKGIFIQCTPDPYFNYVQPFEFIDSGFIASIVYDSKNKSPQHVITVLKRVERWLPANLYGANTSLGLDAFGFITGLDVEKNTERYGDIANGIVARNLKIPEDGWKPELFNTTWPLYQQAPQLFAIYYEDEKELLVKHFIEFPEHWSNEIIEKVLEDCKVAFKNIKKRHTEEQKLYDDRRDRMLEYTAYLESVLRFTKSNIKGWVLPSVNLTKNSKGFAEIDVVTVYLDKEFTCPVKIELFEVSNNDSIDNKEKNGKKLRNVAHQISSRFGKITTEVSGYFNKEKINLS